MRNALRGLFVAVVSLSSACSRDLTLPPAPSQGPGSVSGRAVIAVPGQLERQPAAGTTVSLLSSTASVTATVDGQFTLEGITQTAGGLLFQYGAGDGGTFALQKLIDLADIGAGPGRLVNLGDVLLAEPASLHGRALRADLADERGGQAGTLIFVPEGPFTTYTADDGTFGLEELPEGTFQISAFRAGYTGVTLTGVEARAGEDVTLRDIVLEVETGTPDAGAIAGSLSFVPASDTVGATLVARSVLDSSVFNGTVNDDGTFTVSPLPPGVYDVRASRPDYTTSTAPNVVVQSNQTTQLVITLGTGPSNDPTRPPAPDGGNVPDGGRGTSDAGLCATTVDCPSAQWCDDGLCVPQCAASAQCTNGRVCDTTTRTCVQPCGGGSCPSGQACDSATNLCRAICDGAFPCAATFVCSAAQLCVPECSVSADCLDPHRSCQAGACVFNGMCDIDDDCPLAQLCVLGSCTNRPTAFVDGGVDGGTGFACSVPCDCKSGEVCSAGVCLPDFVPNRFVAADGGGDGLTAATAASSLPAVLTPDASVIVALREGDLFVTDGGPAIISAPHSALVGGFAVCSSNRWVRDGTASSTVSSSTGLILTAHTDASHPLDDLSFEGVDLMLAPATCPSYEFVDIAFADRLLIDRMRVTVPRALPCSPSALTAVNIATSHDVLLKDLSMQPGAQTGYPDLVLAALTSSSGVAQHFTAPSQLISGLTLFSSNTNDAPVTVRDFDVSSVTMSVGQMVPLVTVAHCAAAVSLTGNHLQFPVTANGGPQQLSALQAISCPGVTIDSNDIDGRNFSGTPPASGLSGEITGIWAQDSTGSITNNRIDFFEHATATGGTESGIYITGPRATLDVDRNSITMPVIQSPLTAVSIASVSQPGTLTLHHLTVDGGTSNNVASGIGVDTVAAFAGLSITDVDVRMPSTGNGICTGAFGLAMHNSAAYVERTRFVVPSGTATTGFSFDGSQVELYESFASTGSSTCSSQQSSQYPSAIVAINNATVWATGNTFEVGSDYFETGASSALSCDGSAQIVATSNIFGAGSGPTHTMAHGGCFSPANFVSNYFWYARAGGRNSFDNIAAVTPSDGGVPDGRGNIVNDANLSPYGATPQPTYITAPGSPVIDKGVGGGVRRDGGTIAIDIDGRPRKDGAQVDIGAYEL